MRKIFIIFLLCLATAAIATQLSFNSGQLSDLVKYRVDTDKRAMGAETLENIIVKSTGMAYKRPGTEFIDESASKSNVRLLPFESSTNDAYPLEFTHESIGFFRTVP